MFVAQIGRTRGHVGFLGHNWDEGTNKPAQATAMEAARTLWNDMQQHGMRYGELDGHCDDLVAGHVLTAEDGTAFRVVPLPG